VIIYLFLQQLFLDAYRSSSSLPPQAAGSLFFKLGRLRAACRRAR
jgi:hypothetical protein